MKSLPSIDQVNGEQLMEVIRKLNPELYMIHVALEETGVDPLVIPHVIRALGNLSLGPGYGKIQIFMQARLITDIEATEKIRINAEAVIDKQ